MSGVYTITNAVDGKTYIGSTVGFQNRWRQHRGGLRRGNHGNPHLQAAWNLYGENVFEFGVLEYLDRLEELHLAEQFWMNVYRLEGKTLYNYGLAARSPALGRPRSEKTRRKISEAGRGNQNSLGRKHTKETRHKISEALKGRILSGETRRKISEAMKGNRCALGCKRTAEYVRKMSEARARPFPAFIHKYTGEMIPAGTNLSALCRKRGLHQPTMAAVARGERPQYRGWMLLSEHSQPWLL